MAKLQCLPVALKLCNEHFWAPMKADAYLIIVKAFALLAPTRAAGKTFDKYESPRPERRSGHRRHQIEKASG